MYPNIIFELQARVYVREKARVIYDLLSHDELTELFERVLFFFPRSERLNEFNMKVRCMYKKVQ